MDLDRLDHVGESISKGGTQMIKQARKAPSYASSKLRPTDLLADGGEV